MRDDEAVRRHADEIDRLNQRGGRMLSIVDLLDAGTFGPDLAAHALAAIGRGASFLVGASPGGAGKTTVMGALLNFVPPGIELAPASGPAAIERARREPEPRRCFICHEIGSGDYYAYLWGAELRAYFELAAAGHLLATNLHADTIEEARDQICEENGVREDLFRRVNLLLFLRVARGTRGIERRIETVWEGDGRGPHRLVFQAGPGTAGGRPGPSEVVSVEELRRARAAIDRLDGDGARGIEEVRRRLLETYFA